MKFEKWQKCEVFASDGNWTIGYVDGKPAQWKGNMSELAPGGDFEFSSDDSVFGINAQEDFRVIDRLWEEAK